MKERLMETLKTFPYQAVAFDRKGKVTSGLSDLVQYLGKEPVTDLIVMCHGFRNDAADATNLYSEFLGNLGPNSNTPRCAAPSARASSRSPAPSGLPWSLVRRAAAAALSPRAAPVKTRSV
jgi:hypothetical protein